MPYTLAGRAAWHMQPPRCAAAESSAAAWRRNVPIQVTPGKDRAFGRGCVGGQARGPQQGIHAAPIADEGALLRIGQPPESVPATSPRPTS